MTAPTPDAVVIVERTIPAPPERVFAAWLEPATIARWLSPTGHAEAEVDANVGGRFRVVMLDPDGVMGPPGVRLEHTGSYLEIEPHRRLAFTWVSPFTGPEPSRIVLDFAPAAAGTRLTLRHELLPAAAVASHRGGWDGILDQLVRMFQEA